MQNVVLGFLNFGIGKPTLKNGKSESITPIKKKLIKIKPLTEADKPLAERIETALNTFMASDKYESTLTIRLSHLETVGLPLGFRERAAKLVKKKKLHLVVVSDDRNGKEFSSPTTLVIKWDDSPNNEDLMSLWASIRNLRSLRESSKY